MSALSALSTLAKAESNLIATLDAAAARVGEIATGALDAAFGRFQSALHGAHNRLSRYYVAINELAGAALSDVSDFSTQLLDAIPPSLPVPEVEQLPPVVSLEELLAAESEADDAKTAQSPPLAPAAPEDDQADEPPEADSEGGETDQADDGVDLAATAPEALDPLAPAASPEVPAPATTASRRPAPRRKGGRKKVRA